MITGLALLIITICLAAFALPAVDWLVTRWVHLYTWLLPSEIRDQRREEIRSELFEQRREETTEGYNPVEIAARMLLRSILGIPGDVSWSAERYLNSRRNRKIQITMIADPEAVPIVVGTHANPRAYLVYGLPIIHGPQVDEQSRRAAVQAQVTALWGDELVVAPQGVNE